MFQIKTRSIYTVVATIKRIKILMDVSETDFNDKFMDFVEN